MTEIPQTVVRIAEGGRIVIPAHLRQALGVAPGDEVVLKVDDDGIRLISRKLALARLRKMVAEVVPPGESLVDELLSERRKEARGEDDA
jgi:AbrB family looped-hinge helix DNA binding protein